MRSLEQRVLLSRMEAAAGQTRSHIILIERQIERRAERLTITARAKGRSFSRHSPSWTLEAERLFREHVERIAFERRGEIDALSRKLARQEKAIAMLRERRTIVPARAA